MAPEHLENNPPVAAIEPPTFFKPYQTGVLIIFHTFLLVLIINFALWAFFKIKDARFPANPVIHKYGIERLKPLYPGRSEAEVRVLLHESWSRPMVFDSYTGFKEKPYSGEYLNVSSHGFRFVKNNPPAWPPDPKKYNIFVFGGSTMFGYGVADNETTAAYLETLLRKEKKSAVIVYNFGQGRYFSVQEKILFEKLLLNGHRPKLAIFVDGLNEYHPDGEPYIGSTNDAIQDNLLGLLFAKTPTGRAMTSLQQRLRAQAKKTTNPSEPRESDAENPATINGIISYYVANKKMVESLASAYNIQTLFVWQPIPLYKYDLAYHAFGAEAAGDDDTHQYSKYTYPEFATLIKSKKINPGNNFLWAADIQEKIQEALYVDSVHYAPPLAQSLAQTIADFLKINNYLKK